MRRSIIGIVVIVCMAFGAILIFNERLDNTVDTGYPSELDLFDQKLKDTLLKEIGWRLYEENFSFGLESEMLSKEEVEIVIKLPIEKISNETKNEVNKIINEVVTASDFNPAIFTIRVNDYENQN